MLSYFSTTNGKLGECDEFRRGCWVYMVNPNAEEIDTVCELAKIQPEYIRAALDEEEMGRVENDDGVTLILVDGPVALKDENGSVTYSTFPIGVVFTSECIITVCLKENSVLKDIADGHIRGTDPALKSRFFLKLMLALATRYLKYLKQIDKITVYIENQLYKATKNKEIVQLMALSKSLVYFSTSLKSIETTLHKLERGRLIKLYEEDEELFDDVIIEIRQAREMADIYSSILAGMIDAFASVISNNLNFAMKLLASITIIMAVPTIVSGFYGMNVQGIPLSGSFWFPVGISAVIVAIMVIILAKKKMF
ncbi:MAG: magnesium transporter CorA family protein [Ruminococcaceae bacterium]|nr:magnesium transporter CorA family protein [Oscillospiraceae bacterium]